MATSNISLVTAATFHVVDADVSAQLTGVAGVAVVAGQAISINTSTGKWQLADADVETVRGLVYIALRNAAIGESLTGSKHCVVNGYDLSSLAYGLPIYLSDTAGSLSSATPTGGNAFVVGYIEPLFGNRAGVAPDKVLRFCTL